MLYTAIVYATCTYTYCHIYRTQYITAFFNMLVHITFLTLQSLTFSSIKCITVLYTRQSGWDVHFALTKQFLTVCVCVYFTQMYLYCSHSVNIAYIVTSTIYMSVVLRCSFCTKKAKLWAVIRYLRIVYTIFIIPVHQQCMHYSFNCTYLHPLHPVIAQLKREEHVLVVVRTVHSAIIHFCYTHRRRWLHRCFSPCRSSWCACTWVCGIATY